MILTILPGTPEREQRYVAIRESLASLLKELARPLHLMAELQLPEIAGTERDAVWHALVPLKYGAELIDSYSNVVSDPELALDEVADALQAGLQAATAGIFLLRCMGSTWGNSSPGEPG